MRGQPVSDEQTQAWADEAEAGYNVNELRRRVGRPPRAGDAPHAVATRFSEAELSELMERAQREGLDRSAAIRAAVRQWAHA